MIEEPFVIGDLVRYKNGLGVLRSGCEAYPWAVVASVEPFVLISERGDMRWTATAKAQDFEWCGTADRTELLAVMERLAKDLFSELHPTTI